MFAKLLKHEWKANAPMLGVLSGAAVGVGLLGGVAMQLTNSSGKGEMSEMLSETFASLSYGFVTMVLMLYVAAVGILLLYRFYKNKFTEQGYLTFTLPVTGHQILLSSFVSMLLWELIAVATVIVSLGIMNLVSSIGQDATEAAADMNEIFEEMFMYATDGEVAGVRKIVGLGMLMIPVAAVYGNILAMASITMGASWAKKHKLLAAFGIFYGASYLLNIASSIVSGVTAVLSADEGTPFTTVLASMSTLLIMEILLSVGGYFLAHHMMTKKLNLK